MKIINWIYRRGIVVAILCTLMCTSCEKYLDIDQYVYDKTTIDSIFASRTKIFQYINGTAAYLTDESKYIGDWYPESKTLSPSGMGSDEAIQPWPDDNHPGSKLVIDAITPRNTAGVNPWPKKRK